jgi:adenine deaminase
MSLMRRLRIARGEEAADLILRNARIVNVCSGEIYPGDVIIADGRIVTISEERLWQDDRTGERRSYQGREERDLEGYYLAPGLIDGHMHLESTMMVMGEFARAVVPHGTTTVIIDPHEFANVLGVPGIRYAIDSARSVPLNVYVMLSSCVPASPLESPRQPLLTADMLPLLDEPGVLGLAEMMNVSGVLHGDAEVLAKIEATRACGRVVDGHAPGERGHRLRTYAAAGIQSDHESTTVAEAREKLRLGLWLMIREGSAARNLEALLPLISELHPSRAFFVTDDRDPIDLCTRGHIDSMLRTALNYGLDPIEAIRLASYNAAQYFRLDDCGAIAPGYRADLLVVSDLQSFAIEAVYKDGKLVAEHGEPLFSVATPQPEELAGITDTIHIAPVTQEQLRLPGRTGPATVIGVAVGQITTRRLIEPVTAQDGHIVADPERDLLKLVVVERHHGKGRVGVGLVKGFGLRRGALASSVAHDAHNLVIVGASDADILAAIDAVRAIGGGFAVVANGTTLATLPLPIGGLVSPQPARELAAQLRAIDSAAAALGCILDHPFMTLSFLSLSVIPEVKLTDQGLVDVMAARVVGVQT